MLKLKNIVKEYGTGDNIVRALKGVSFEFRKQEFVSILGPSGCGKTTLLNIIGGLDRYTSGDLIIEGKSTKDFNDKDWDAYRNNSIGFVFQSYNLIPHQSVIANVELALELSGIKKAERRKRAKEILKKVGLSEQENKKPNQLSGGQMQRVAIARALINNPEIILADEPTGALDTETSVQVMEILKEISKEKLVIMVTHNPELANKYSTRIINLLDGETVSDSNPYEDKASYEIKKTRKPKMGFKTAFTLSIKNLFSKKARTVLTSIAGSIGIIGVALVLALSNGFNIYMTRMQTDTLSSYPLTISENSVDLSTFSELYEGEMTEKYKALDNVLVRKAFDKLTGMLKSNNISDEFLEELNKIPDSEKYAITYSYGFDMNDYILSDITINGYTTFRPIDTLVSLIEKRFEGKLQQAMGLSTNFVRQYIPTVQKIPNSESLIREQYDVLYGRLPSFDKTNANSFKDVVLVVDEYNSVSDITLALLGYIGAEFDATSFNFEDKPDGLTIADIVGKKLYVAPNNVLFTKTDDYTFNVNMVDKTNPDLIELNVVGIIREKKNVSGVLDTGICYTEALAEKLLTLNENSEIVAAAKEADEYNKEHAEEIAQNILTAKSVTLEYHPLYGLDNETATLRSVAGNKRPSSIYIYARNFQAKESIKQRIDNYNARWSEDDPIEKANKIYYSDMMSSLFSVMSTMVDSVTYVLVAFTSISLIVSSVMIGIITYTSVVERTKEIGVLRSLGASKGEIANVFNAETFLVGLFSGLLGVGVTYLLCLPINIILTALVPDVGSLAIFSPLTALLLIAVSILLTIVAGLIPSHIASKKDPVVALRTE